MAMTGGTAKLVKTTYPFSDSSKAVNLYIYYKTTQDMAKNKSTVYCGMYVTTPSGWEIGQWDDWDAASYVGTKSNTFNGTIPNFSGTRWIAENKSFTVDHNADGTGKATIYWKWNVNSPWGSYVYPSGSFEIDLPQIPRATTPTLSASTAQMGKSITISMPRASSTFTHKLKYTINGTTKDIASSLDTSYAWTIPTNLVQYIPNKLKDTVTITCETYSGDTKIGTKTVNFTATVPDASVPRLSASSVQMGKVLTIYTDYKSNYYTHTLKYTLGGTTKEIATGVGFIHDWTVPDLVALMPWSTTGEATITCVTYNGTAVVGTNTVNVEIQVYGVSVISIPGTSTDTRVEMGTEITINIRRQSPHFNHKLTYVMGDSSGTIGGQIEESTKWVVPVSLVKEIPNALNGTVDIYCETWNKSSGLYIGSRKKTLKLTVPGASVPSYPTDTPIVMDKEFSLAFNRKSDYYKHDLYFSLGDAEDSKLNISGNVTKYTVPLSFAKEIPNDTSGIIAVRCITYNGTAVVGETKTSFRATVPNKLATQPDFTVKVEPFHGLSSQFDKVYVQGKSKVMVTFDAKSEYAEIKSYSIKVYGTEGSAVSGNIAVSSVLNISKKNLMVECTVTDSRGYSSTSGYQIDVHPYSAPKFVPFDGEQRIVCTRSKMDGTIDRRGEYVLIKAKASYSDIATLNKCRTLYRYKLASASDYSMDWRAFDGTEINKVIDDNVFVIKSAYTVQLKVEDDIGEDKVYTYNIPYFAVPVHMGEGGNNLGLGQFCDYSEPNRIDVGWKTYFNTGIGKKVVFEADSSSGWRKGTILSEVFEDADTTFIMEYSLFLAIVTSVSDSIPTLCVRYGSKIYGASDALQMVYNADENALTLENITDTKVVTALYALL